MQIQMLGTGHATATECYNTCFVINNAKGDYFLIDTGGGNAILKQLKSAQIPISKIKSIFISHIHMDHILGAVWLIRILVKMFFKGELNENIYFYGNDEVIMSLENLCNIFIPKDFTNLIGKKIKFVIVRNNERKIINDFDITFFDLNAKKAKQYGFVIKQNNCNYFAFIGDETCSISTENYLKSTECLFADAYMAGEKAEEYNPIEKHHHSTVKFVSELATRLKVKNLIMSHTMDDDLLNRKNNYTQDAKKYFCGNVFVPDDLEIIEL